MIDSLDKIIIYSDRLALVMISHRHAEDVFREFKGDVLRYMCPKPSETIEGVYAWIDRALAGVYNGTNIQMVITNKITGEFLGCAGLHEIDTSTPELGVWVKLSAHGHGYGREAMHTLKAWADQNIKYTYIRYLVAVHNVPSRNIAESFGGIVERTYRAKTQDGIEHDFVEYRIYPKS